MPMSGFGQDCRYALRGLRNEPGFTVMVLLILALAVGASTAVFSVVDAIVLRALPFDEHDRLVAVGERRSGMPGPGVGSIAPQNFLDWREQQEVFDALASFAMGSFTFQEPGREPEEIRVMRVSSEFFDVLRAPPMLGRGFLPENEIDGRHRVAVISYGFWQSRFGGAPDVLGKSMPLEGASYEIAGVARPDFSYPVSAEIPTQVWVPLVVPADERIRTPGRFSSYLQGIARLKAGVSLDRAAAQMNQMAIALETEHPEWNKDRRIGVRPLYDHIVGDRTRSWMLMLMGAVALVLLIACANIANLMLARASTRTQEMSVRAAIGANRWRIARQFLIDGSILSLAGSAAGVLLASWGVQILRGAMPESMPRVASIALDLRVLGVAAAAAVITALVFGIVPAVQFSRVDVAGRLKDGGRGASAGRVQQRVRGGLVVLEIALAVVLLVGAGLFIASFVRLMHVDPGFDPRRVLTARVYVRDEPGGVDRGSPALVDIVNRVRQLPGVEQAAAISGNMPLFGAISSTSMALPARPAERRTVLVSYVTADYHRAMRIPLRRGRYIQDSDGTGSAPVALINEAMAAAFFPGEDPLRRTVQDSSPGQGSERAIVGVVADVRRGLETTINGQVSEGRIFPEIYVPLPQGRRSGGELVIRTAGEPLAVLPDVRAAAYSVLPDVPLRDVRTLEEVMSRATAQRRLSMLLLSAFGVLGLVIAALGVYALMAYLAAQRTHEIGVRMALGATRGQVITMFLRHSATLAFIGLALGTAGAWTLSSTAGAFLFQIEPTDWRVFTAALIVLGLCAVTASAIPARRAARVDPLVALRYE
jgi:putative ABC transport system permease protein